VVLHNAASPNTPRDLVLRCLEAAGRTGAAQAYVPAHHTVVRLVDGTVDRVVSTDPLGYTADPTVYRIGLLRNVLSESSQAAGEMTLDLVRRQGAPVAAVESPPGNIKVTVPTDLVVLGQLM
jgi:2-C-methyl-D-erythritol 4-phosphate cytidylyltransferase